MAVAHYQYCNETGWSQWVVVYPDGSKERCHNRGTAVLLATRFNAGVN